MRAKSRKSVAMIPVIFGLSGLEPTPEERALFRDVEPAGYILFKRNIETRAQVRALTDELRALSARENVPILIDQEGGRVARMQPPEWPKFPAGEPFGALYNVAPMTAIEAVRNNAEALAVMLAEVGINVNCAPLLDVRQPGAHDVIGDRAFGSDPMMVASLGRAVLDGLKAGGCAGIVKHMPGHGRTMCDTHLDLPFVEASAEELEADIAPFIALNDATMAMSAHIVFKAWDAERPATLSPIVIEEIIRGRIGFDGLLFTDDIDMKALSGTPAEKSVAALAAGCDIVLDCWGRMDEMIAISSAVGEISTASRARLDRAMDGLVPPADPAKAVDRLAALMDKRDALLAYA
jgi:beta-N-acetylhexosaminidase